MKTAEEILFEYFDTEGPMAIFKNSVLKAMEAYADQYRLVSVKPFVDCPFCCKRAHLMIEQRELIYQKIPHKVAQFYYKCPECKEEFTDTVTDELTLSQVYNKK